MNAIIKCKVDSYKIIQPDDFILVQLNLAHSLIFAETAKWLFDIDELISV